MPSGLCRVFISYNTRQREDRTLARGLRQCLLDCSVDAVFRDEESLKPGDVWKDVIDAEIERCSHLVVFITEAMPRSKEVMREVELARDLDAKVVPVIIGDPRRNPFAQIHALRLTQSHYIESLDRDIEEICDKISEETGVATRKGTTQKPRGRLTSLLCDRSTEEGRLRGALAAHLAEKPNEPAALFVCGNDDDQPESFITRLMDTLIRKWVVDSETAALAPVRLEWPEGVAARSMVAGLKLQLLQDLALFHGDPSEDAFVKQMCELNRKGLVIVHTLRCDAWDPDETPRALESYLQLWERVAATPGKPFVVLIFKVLYSDLARQVQPAAGAGNVRRSLAAAIKPWIKTDAKVSVIVPVDLPLVDREQVEAWFKDYAPHVPFEERRDCLDTLFRSGSEQPMKVVEAALGLFVAR